MKRLSVAPQAQRDIDETLRFSESRFGADAARRYRKLIMTALLDLRRRPNRIGVRAVEGAAGVFTYHLRHSRLRIPAAERVARPRHLLAFQAPRDALHIARLLHESMDLPAHLSDSA